ncbi:MbcA/ParS/Xre antitoxin family protein [Paraburkholderia bannensis]|uniref:MbcA/ParS/Xre antitoxin family protein n=1 Tax=Paraburkholderia bannensis TaxID=765414 RepID=UPI002AB73FE6|nr:MbcA/ParS/Xre antitoxin family protein [Paraburkholderia bannensis]
MNIKRVDEDRQADCDASANLVELVRKIVAESGDQEIRREFDAGNWLRTWLARPNPALGGVRPAAFLDTREGRRVLATLITRMQSGAYA